jgi:lipoprotein-anchoring transpeptidase ErfK/SrfK
MLSALLASAFCLPASADPLQITPDSYAGSQRWQAPAPAAVEPSAGDMAQPRYATADQRNMGGGFIEFLFGGGFQQQPYAQRAYQPAMPEYQQDPGSNEPPRYMPGGPAGADQAHAPMDSKYLKQEVDYDGKEHPGTIVIDTPHKFLFLVEPNGKALRYGIGVGRPGFTWSGVKTISAKREWPDWRPPADMLKRRPDLPHYMAGGPENPLGARAMYLGSTLYRIHGSNEPWTIGTNVSSGCIRMRNEDVIDLYSRVSVGTKVVVI